MFIRNHGILKHGIPIDSHGFPLVTMELPWWWRKTGDYMGHFVKESHKSPKCYTKMSIFGSHS